MRRHLIAAALLVPAAALAVVHTSLFSSQPAAAQAVAQRVAQHCTDQCTPKWMDAHLRMDQLQVVGTAESYKQRPDKALMGLIRMGGKKDAEALDYGLPAISSQLDNDVRALSFDVAFDPKGGAYKNPAGAGMSMDLLPGDYLAAMGKPGFKVMHVIDIDYNSSCLALRDCLEQVAAWSRAHPRHLPIVITLRTNDARTPMPGATKPLPCDGAAMDALDTEIRAVFHDGEFITPDMVQGQYTSLREAVTAHAWPRLGAARGKVVFVLDDSADKAKSYQGARKSLEGRAMFVTAPETAPNAAFIAIADPVKEQARIQAAVKAGFMVTTRADADTREARAAQTARRDAAFASGAQVVETNFAAADPAIGPYRVSLEDNAQAMCGKRIGSERCVRFDGADATPYRTAAAAAMP
jgi:hypothetical protein